MFRKSTPALASFVTQLFDGRIDYTDLFPYPTCDRSASEPGAANVKKLLEEVSEGDNKAVLVKALLASQMPPLAPPEDPTAAEAQKNPAPRDFGINATNTSQDTVSFLAQSVFSNNNNNKGTTATPLILPHQITSEIATHVGVGSYILRTLAPEFSSEVQGVAAGNTTSIVLVDEKVSGSFVAANTSSASYDDDKMMYMLEGEKYIASWEGSNSNSNSNSNSSIVDRKILLVLARADTQVTNAKGEQEMVRRLAWFPVDLSSKEAKETVQITSNNKSGSGVGGATIRFNKTPVQGGNVLGAIGDGFRHNGVATLSTQHVIASCICGLVQKALGEIASSEQQQQNNMNNGKLAILQANLYAIESTAYAFATNLDRQMSETIIESACLASASYRLASQVRSFIEHDVLPSSSSSSQSSLFIKSCADGLHDLMSALGHPDQMTLLAGCCGVEDYGLKLNKRPTLEMTTLRTQRALGQIDHFPSLVVCQNSAKLLEKQIVTFSKIVHQAFVNNGPAVLYREALLTELGNVATLMYTSSCVLARANRCSASKQQTSESETKLATLYMDQTGAALEALLEKAQREAVAPSRLAERLTRFYINRYSSAPFKKSAEGKSTVKK